jgi:molybdopterin-binding protein
LQGSEKSQYEITQHRGRRLMVSLYADTNITPKETAMKISARNILKGKITEVTKGATTSHVVIDIGGGVLVTSSITNAAVDDLKLAKGKDAYAVIKASDVMVAID